MKQRTLMSSRPQRRLMVDSQVELQTYLEEAEKECMRELRQPFINQFNKKIMSPSRIPNAKGEKEHLLDLLEFEIRPLPSPSSRAHVIPAVEMALKVMTANGR
jgi:hypothetical protein